VVIGVDRPDMELLALAVRDKDAWDAYGSACHDPTMTDERRRELYDHASDALERLTDLERELKYGIPRK
jgi:hypothetical protein